MLQIDTRTALTTEYLQNDSKPKMHFSFTSYVRDHTSGFLFIMFFFISISLLILKMFHEERNGQTFSDLKYAQFAFV